MRGEVSEGGVSSFEIVISDAIADGFERFPLGWVFGHLQLGLERPKAKIP